eukprot:6184050-Pleurochrysis_carterae.AAC.2
MSPPARANVRVKPSLDAHIRPRVCAYAACARFRARLNSIASVLHSPHPTRINLGYLLLVSPSETMPCQHGSERHGEQVK